MLAVKVIKAGLLTTIQDLGRSGYQHLGIPVGGALDLEAARRANALVGNPPEAPVLEICLSGPQLAFSAAAQIVISGAELSPRLDDQLIPNEQLFHVAPGQVLQFGRCEWGCRAYLAIRGHWQVKYWLGSASCASTAADSCTPGAKLRQGDVLRIKTEPAPVTTVLSTLPYSPDRVVDKPWELDVYPAPEFRQMSRAWLAAFFTHSFTVSAEMDRMGCRLRERLRVPDGIGQMLSSGVLPGTVQLTPDGRLIILLADAQTTGGYYRLVQLSRNALSLLAQAKPGDKLRFIRGVA